MQANRLQLNPTKTEVLYGVRHPDVNMLSHPDRFVSTVLLYCQLLQSAISGYILTLTSP